MGTGRFELALEKITSGQWRLFEKLAAEYLAVDYPSLRSMASTRGDKGRDGEIYEPTEGQATVVAQYSVTPAWKAKIRQTVSRLAETNPHVRTLMYVTNQDIGPDADELRIELSRDSGVLLDVRDKDWFLDRQFTHAQREVAAEELGQVIVDPLLQNRGVIDSTISVLDHNEAHLALLQLTLDIEDRATDKGLTKQAFESLVISALEGTDADNTIGLSELQCKVRVLMPAETEQQINDLTKAALARIAGKGKAVHHHKNKDEYCLSAAKVAELRERIAQHIQHEHDIEVDIIHALRYAESALGEEQLTGQAKVLRRCVEQLLLRKGEQFATAVSTGAMPQTERTDFEAVLLPHLHALAPLTMNQAVAVLLEFLQRPSETTQYHLRRLADAYTLFAFLRQTPDVQKTMSKLFSGGSVWLDASIILPMLAEQLLDDKVERRFTTLLGAARDAGMRLFVTDGIIEEVERHINKSVACARTGPGQWRSYTVPFLFSVYMMSGRARTGFGAWAEEFRGSARPEEDVAETLQELFGISRRDLSEESANAPVELRAAVQELWQEAHDRRRQRDSELDDVTRARLVAHDVDNCVGVMQLRKGARTSAFGYSEWFLTLDRLAFALPQRLRRWLGDEAPDSPVLSPDFLSEYLRISLMRQYVEVDNRVNLPLLTDVSRLGGMPTNLIRKAESVRMQGDGLPERVVRRRVRDTLDRERVRLGAIAHGGITAVEQDFSDKFGQVADPVGESSRESEDRPAASASERGRGPQR